MKDPRNPHRWRNEEIAESPQAYLQAQEAHREDQAAERARLDEQRDRELFEREFVAAGGTRTGVESAWMAKRDREATEAADRTDQTARRVQRGAAMGAI